MLSARKILIADPDVTAARELASRLTALGYEVTGLARSAEEVIDMAAQAAPDLVFIETRLGAGNDGVPAADGVRRLRATPVIFVSRDDDEAALRRAGVTEPYGYLVTPFTNRELRVNVELALCREEALREARAREERFFDVSLDMLCVLNFNGYFKRLNPAWERTLGFTVGELMSRPFIEFVHPDDRDRTLRQNGEVRGGGQALAFENRYLCKDGSFRWFLWNAASDRDDQVIFSMARDVTARKRAEEEREKLVRDLRAALAEVTDLREILPICSYCRKIRDDENYWHSVESYLSRHTNARFSHGICPSCTESVVEPQLEWLDGQ